MGNTVWETTTPLINCTFFDKMDEDTMKFIFLNFRE